MTTRALVLGGGGLAGIGWEVGVLAGLAAGGVDVRDADLVVGTSAGSAVGSLVAHGEPLEDLYLRQLEPSDSELGVDVDLAAIGAAFVSVLDGDRDPQRLRARVGALALATATVDEAVRRAVISARLGERDWPATPLRITACDAVTGEFRAFGADDGVPLVDAVAASCAVPLVWPAVTIAGRRWLDGGIRSLTSADLAAGHDAVLVVAPMTLPAGWPLGGGLEAEVAALEAAGSQVVVVTGDAASTAVFGSNPLDPATAAPAARLGRAQGAAAVADLAPLWCR